MRITTAALFILPLVTGCASAPKAPACVSQCNLIITNAGNVMIEVNGVDVPPGAKTEKVVATPPSSVYATYITQLDQRKGTFPCKLRGSANDMIRYDCTARYSTNSGRAGMTEIPAPGRGPASPGRPPIAPPPRVPDPVIPDTMR